MQRFLDILRLESWNGSSHSLLLLDFVVVSMDFLLIREIPSLTSCSFFFRQFLSWTCASFSVFEFDFFCSRDFVLHEYFLRCNRLLFFWFLCDSASNFHVRTFFTSPSESPSESSSESPSDRLESSYTRVIKVLILKNQLPHFTDFWITKQESYRHQ